MKRIMKSRFAGLTAVAAAGLMGWGCGPTSPTPTNPAPTPNPAGTADPAPAEGEQTPPTPQDGRGPGGRQAGAEPTPTQEPVISSESEADSRYALDFTVNRIEGGPESLEAYRGKVVMVVNVASACGLTPQYEGLQALYADKADDGLVILGFPANNFGNQEPGSNKEIQEFCSGEYHVTFPMFEKVSVTGEDQHPLFAKLSQEGGPPTWNFTKYLVDREGRVVARFDPRTKPDDAALVARVEELLAAE